LGLSAVPAYAAAPAEASKTSDALDTISAGEIIVTAQKREERLRDVPMSSTTRCAAIFVL